MRRLRWTLWSAAVLLAVSLAGGYDGNAQTKVDKPKTPGAKVAKEEKLPAFTPEREAAALTFARRNHPELADLLAQLKTTNHNEYERAIRELFQTSETLADTKVRDPQRYDVDLRGWIVQSRIRLLAARISMARSPALESELKAALNEQLDVRIQHLTLERDRLAGRVQKLDSDIAAARAGRDQDVEKRLHRLVHAVRKVQSDVKAKTGVATGAAKKPGRETPPAQKTGAQQ
jgi:hypothetical protein